MWSSVLRSLTQGYLQMMINSVLNIQKMRVRKTKDYSNDAVTCLTFMILCAFPFFIYVLLYRLKHFKPFANQIKALNYRMKMKEEEEKFEQERLRRE
jgi:hypothetical protein